MDLNLQESAFSLKRLRRLHLIGGHEGLAGSRIKESIVKHLGPMSEIIYTVVFWDNAFLTKIIRQSGSSLEILVLYPNHGRKIDLTPDNPPSISPLAMSKKAPTAPLPSHHHLCALTQLDLQVELTNESFQYISTILPRLGLVHFGCHTFTYRLLQDCNFASLKSISMMNVTGANLERVLDATEDGTGTSSCSGLEQLFIRYSHKISAERPIDSTVPGSHSL